MKIAIINLAYHTNTPTGGDTIAIECAKSWMSMGNDVRILTTSSGKQYCISHGFPKENIVVLPISFVDPLGYEAAIFIKTIFSIAAVFALKNTTYDMYFASSFFLPDSIPAFISRLLHVKSIFLTSMYVYTRRYFGSEYSGGKVKGFFFWIHEAIAVKSVFLTNGFVLTSSSYDAKELLRLTHIPQAHIHAVVGGVDFNFFESVPPQPYLYDAVFVGRFKPQKCIEELIEIWSIVVKSKPRWKLAIIGGGPLENKLRSKVRFMRMSESILFLGVLDGIEKVKILKSSRLFVSASVYDTGNIALDEALACSIPGIIYDLPSMPYDKGVIHIQPFDSHAFAEAIIRVGTDDAFHSTLSIGAKRYAQSIEWKNRAKEILTSIFG